MSYDITGLEKTKHQSPEGLPLYVYQDLGVFRILTDGQCLYKERPDRKGIDIYPVAEGCKGYILTEASPVDQFFISLKNDVKELVISYLKSNPTCSLDDVLNYIETERDATHSSLAKLLLGAYEKFGDAEGLFEIPEDASDNDKFVILRDFIVNCQDVDSVFMDN